MSNKYKHDVFISYSHHDSEWVFKILVPHLQENKLRVFTDQDFQLGPSSIDNMEKAVKESKVTIIVLSQNWIESEYSQFEGFLSAKGDAAGKKARLIPVMIGACSPPQYIDMRTRAEFLEKERFEAEMKRLVRNLKETDPNDPVKIAADALHDGADILRKETYRPAFSEAWCRLFQNACAMIDRLADFKDVHDQLHQLQVQCYDMIVREANRLESDDEAVENLTIHTASLQSVTEKIRSISKRASFTGIKCDWIDNLTTAHQRLLAAIEEREMSGVMQAARMIDRILAVQPALFNTRLVEAANALHLDDLLGTIKEVMTKLGNAAEVLQATKAMIETLCGDLKNLLADHDRWQETDTDLRRVEKNPEELMDAWPHLKSRISELVGSGDWAQPLQKEEQSIDSAIATSNQKEMCSHLRLLRRHAVIRFYKVDSELKERCDTLRTARKPLEFMVRPSA